VASAVAILVIVPVVMRVGPGEEATGSFTARGSASAIATFDVACHDTESGTCHSGDKLVFDLQGSAGYPYFAAFARREDATVIWCFPESEDGRSLDLRERLSDGILDRGVLVDGEHTPGRWQVYGIFSSDPLSRDDIKSRFQEGAADLGPGTAITVRELIVE